MIGVMAEKELPATSKAHRRFSDIQANKRVAVDVEMHRRRRIS
jgi:hypothetical protein